MANVSGNIEWILQDSLEALLIGEVELEAILAQYPEHSEELRPRLEAVLWLNARKPALDPTPGFIESSANRLVARLEREAYSRGAVREAGWAPLDWVNRRLAGLSQVFTRRVAFQLAMAMVLVISVLFGFYATARASQSALPGEPLYGVKIGLERVELSLAFSDFKRAELHVRFAQRRLLEIQELIMENRYGQVAQAVADFEDQVSKANKSLEIAASRDPARAKTLLVDLQESLTTQQAVITALTPTVPTQVRPEIDRLLAATGEGLTSTQELLDGIGDLIETGLTATPTATPTPLVTMDATATNTPLPTLGPTRTMSALELMLTPDPAITRTGTIVAAELDVEATLTPSVIRSLDEEQEQGQDGSGQEDNNKEKKAKKDKKLPKPPNRKKDPPGLNK